MKSFLLSACFMLFAAGQAVSQDGSEGDMGVKTTIEALPSLNAALSIGFNYDFIKQPTDVSFEYPRGYFGLNIPFRQNLPILDIAKGIEPSLDSILSDSTLIRDGNEFKPTASAKQNANTTVRVDVPMLGGVATFSNMQNFYLSYMNVLGNPSFYIAPDSAMDGLSFAMRGAVDVPLEMSLSWETMTFGYAYRVNPNIIFAFNLHRHLFVLDVAAQVNVDILGAFRFEPVVAGGGADVGGISVEGEINYNAERTRGVARAHYKAETWSPTFGIDLWRFGWTSRFGVDTRVKGEFEAVYSLPFFIDPETFSIGISDAYALLDGENRSKLLNNAVDSVRYYIEPQENYLRWRMPHGHTMSFDLVPDKLRISYTKFFGEIGMNLSGIRKEVTTLTEQDTTEVGFDIGFTVDNIIMLNGHWRNAFFNLGVFGIDFRAGSRDHLLGGALDKAGWVMLGDQAMVPILNLGSAIGSKLQLLLELDILPLPAVKTGIFYYF